MNFEDFLSQAWNEHAESPAEVASRLGEVIKHTETEEHIVQSAALITHVFGEHLGEWNNGTKTLNYLKTSRFFNENSESGAAVARSIASLKIASGADDSLDEFSISDQIRILVIASSALCEHQDVKRAEYLFRQGLKKCRECLRKTRHTVHWQ